MRALPWIFGLVAQCQPKSPAGSLNAAGLPLPESHFTGN